MTDEKTVAAATGAGIMAGITVIISLVAIVFGVIGIIGASNLFKGKKAGRSLSNVWAIALIIIFLIGLIPSIVSIMNMGATTAGLQSLTTDSTANIGTAEVQAAVSSLPIIMIVLSAIFYLLPAILVFILLKGKAVKDFFAATQA